MNKPVTIITGFLGVGKTTFLNHLMNTNKNTRFAIIENEYGERGIDNEIIMRPEETIIELNNGCLCCTLNDNLYDILNELFEKRNDFDELVIEATGVADPTGLAQPFIVHPLIKKHFPLKAIICLVDAEQVEDHLNETEEALNQISYSDILLINKIDLVSNTYVSEIESRLRQLNPLADVIKGQQNSFPKIVYRSRIQEKLEQLMVSHNKINTPDQASLSFPVSKPLTHHHHKHTAEINSHTLVFVQPFDFQALYHHLLVYLTFQSKGLYRIKGLIWFENKPHQFILQSAGNRLDLQENRTWKPNEPKQSVIVFIGKNLQVLGLEKLLKKCLVQSKATVNLNYH